MSQTDTPRTMTELIQSVNIQISGNSQFERFQAKYRNNRVAFAYDILPGIGKTLAPYQEEILSLYDMGHAKVAVRGPHGLGKTTIAAILTHHMVLTAEDDAKVPTTASSWRQLEFYLWPEIKKISKFINWTRVGREPYNRNEFLSLAIKLNGGTIEAMAVASDDAQTIEGAHGRYLFYIFDEAKAIPVGTWDAAEGAFSNANKGRIIKLSSKINPDDLDDEHLGKVIIKDDGLYVPDIKLVKRPGIYEAFGEIFSGAIEKRITEETLDELDTNTSQAIEGDIDYEELKRMFPEGFREAIRDIQTAVRELANKPIESREGVGLEADSGSGVDELERLELEQLPPAAIPTTTNHDAIMPDDALLNSGVSNDQSVSSENIDQNCQIIRTPRMAPERHPMNDDIDPETSFYLCRGENQWSDTGILNTKSSANTPAPNGIDFALYRDRANKAPDISTPEFTALALAISTPGEPSGRFYDIHSHKPGYEDWYTRHVTVQEAIDANRISSEWVDQRRRQWGEDSQIFQNRVLGEFADVSEDGMIPRSWILGAVQRWYDWDNKNRPEIKSDNSTLNKRVLGCDIARGGGDKTVLAVRDALVITKLMIYSKLSLPSIAGHIKSISNRRNIHIEMDGGLGAGVYDICRSEDVPNLRPITVSAPTTWRDRSKELQFINVRAAMWWNMRELLDPERGEPICLPPIEELILDLSTPRYMMQKDATVQLESKDNIEKRIGRSTDYGDAVCLAFWGASGGGGVVF